MLNLKLCWVRHSYICQLKYLSVLLSVVYYGKNINLMIIHEIYKWKPRKLYRIFVVLFCIEVYLFKYFPQKAIFRGKISNCKGTGPCTKKGQLSPGYTIDTVVSYAYLYSISSNICKSLNIRCLSVGPIFHSVSCQYMYLHVCMRFIIIWNMTTR